MWELKCKPLSSHLQCIFVNSYLLHALPLENRYEYDILIDCIERTEQDDEYCCTQHYLNDITYDLVSV